MFIISEIRAYVGGCVFINKFFKKNILYPTIAFYFQDSDDLLNKYLFLPSWFTLIYRRYMQGVFLGKIRMQKCFLNEFKMFFLYLISNFSLGIPIMSLTVKLFK